MQEPELEMKETRVPIRLRFFILEVGVGAGKGGSACSGGEGPAQLLQPPSACANKLPSYSAALPPESVCPFAPPRPRQG